MNQAKDWLINQMDDGKFKCTIHISSRIDQATTRGRPRSEYVKMIKSLKDQWEAQIRDLSVDPNGASFKIMSDDSNNNNE
eukprot:UN07502